VKILLTGGAGFIGERLASALAAEDNEVHLVDNLSRGHRDEALQSLVTAHNVRFYDVDLLAPGALDCLPHDYDGVVHLAAILGVQNVLDRPFVTLRDNVLMQDAAIHFARRQKGLQRFLFASTSEVYAGSLLHLEIPVPTPEDVPLALPALHEPRSSYMLSKLYGEAMLRHSGLPFTIVRPHNIYGPRMGMSHVIPQLLQKAHTAPPHSAIEVFSVEHRRSFCFIDDAVEMLKRVLFSPSAGNQVLNLGSEGPEVTIKSVAEIIIATVGKPLQIREGAATPGSPTRRAPKMTRMTEATGYLANVSLEEGIRRTYDWYRTHSCLGQ
jgi:nucleoside-diphosphate-sugar epimerase